MEPGPPPSDRPESRPSGEDPIAKLSGSRGVSSLGGAGKYAGLGFQFVASILLFLWVGQWLDRKLGTDGPFVLLGVFVGAGAAFYSMYRGLMADQRGEEEAEARRRAAAEQSRQEKQDREGR